MPNKEKVVLAYSGGLDTSIIIPWLKENYSYDVIAMVGDVGQGDDIEAVIEKAYKTGASKVVVEDMREEFLTGYVFPSLTSGRGLRTQIFAGDIDGPACHRQASGRSRAARRRHCGFSRMHRQRKRSGAFRVDLSSAGSGVESDRAMA